MTTSGRRINTHLAKFLICNHAYDIIEHHLDEIEAAVPPQDIVFYCVSTLPSDSVRLISAIEARHPRLVAQARDLFGNNALWYGLFRTGRNECESAVEQRLLELGCDPTVPNCYGLSYNDIKAARRILNEA